MQRAVQQPSSVSSNMNSSNHNSKTTSPPSSGNNNNNGISRDSLRSLKKKGSKRKRTPLFTKLLYAIGSIAVCVAVVNYIHSLKHQGFLPAGITFSINFGDGATHSKYVIGKPSGSSSNSEDPTTKTTTTKKDNDMPDIPRNLHATDHRKEPHHNKASPLLKHHDDIHRQHPNLKQGGSGIWTVEKSSSVNNANATEAHDHDSNKPPHPIKKELIGMAKAGSMLDGRRDVLAKEAKKGAVHPIRYYMQLSQQQGHDKEHLLKLIRENAGIQFISESTYNDLPSLAEVTAMYGNHPRLVATEQCQAFQSQGDLGDKFLAVAGTFNSGTNLLAKLLTRNCVLHHRQAKYGVKNRGIRWQVPYGKHTPPGDEDFRNSHVAQKSDGVVASNVLPAVMIRDPFRWLQSMCSHHYTSRWPRVFPRKDPRYHCPNLFPTADEKAKLAALGQEPLVEGQDLVREYPNSERSMSPLDHHLYAGIRPESVKSQARSAKGAGGGDEDEEEEEEHNNDDETADIIPQLLESEPDRSILSEEDLTLHHFPVNVKYSNYTRQHRSLVHMYNEWYQEYFDLTDFPHIFVRMEDLLFFPDQVVPQICECAGGRMISTANNPGNRNVTVKVVAQSAKSKHSTKYMEEGQEHTGYLDALIRYGKSSTRFHGMTPHDLQYAQKYLDKNFMKVFGYGYPDDSLLTGNSETGKADVKE